MRNFYSISKWQLITLWAGGVMTIIWASNSYNDFASLLGFAVPVFLVFYSIGWHNHRNTH